MPATHPVRSLSPAVVWTGTLATCLGCGMTLQRELDESGLPWTTGRVIARHGDGEGCPNYGKRFEIELPVMREIGEVKEGRNAV